MQIIWERRYEQKASEKLLCVHNIAFYPFFRLLLSMASQKGKWRHPSKHWKAAKGRAGAEKGTYLKKKAVQHIMNVVFGCHSFSLSRLNYMVDSSWHKCSPLWPLPCHTTWRKCRFGACRGCILFQYWPQSWISNIHLSITWYTPSSKWHLRQLDNNCIPKSAFFRRNISGCNTRPIDIMNDWNTTKMNDETLL